jgi:hypothetical protein
MPMNHDPPLRIALDEAGFRQLVAGQVVLERTTSGLRVEIILSDIGWTRMIRAVFDGMPEQNPPDPPQAVEFLPRRRAR